MAPRRVAEAENDYKTVFKPPSSKIVTDRNRFSTCGLSSCKNDEHPGQPKFPICASCKHTRYCCREHQIADWKSHKAACRESLARDKAEGILASSGVLTDVQIVNNLVRDYVQLHESTFHQIVNYLYHTTLPVLLANEADLSRATALVKLKYRPDCDGNPARAFELIHVVMSEVLGENGVSDSFIEYRDCFNANRKNDPTFIQGMVARYNIIGYESHYQTTGLNYSHWIGVYKPEAPFKLEKEWNTSMMTMLHVGIVLRKVEVEGADRGRWVPGSMYKSGSKWIWKPIPPHVAARHPLPPVEHWGRQKSTIVLPGPGGKGAWVAPEGFLWED